MSATTFPDMTMEQLQAAMDRWAEDQGWPYGVPIPSLGGSEQRLVIAKRAPLGDREVPILSMPEMLGHVVPRELRDDPKLKVVNTWWGRDGFMIYVVEREDGKREAYMGPHPVADRMRRFLQTIHARQGAVTARAEARAMVNLADRLSDVQAESYVLNSCFIETSKRSGVRYIFRRGLPTLALSDRGDDDGGIKFLAALCMHPLAYYEDTFAGSMAPSDDVLAHLLMMRGDEHRFWRMSNQHRMWDPRSGV